MILIRILFIFSLLAQLSACASNTSKVNGNNLEPMQSLSENFLLKRNPQNHTIGLLKDNNPTLALYKKAANSQTMQQAAVSFLQKHRKDFLITNPAKEFKVSSNKTDDLGLTRIKLNQFYQGIPVWQGVISMHFNRKHELQIVRGEYFPTPTNVDINAGLSSTALFQKVAILDTSITQSNYTLHKIIYFKNITSARLAYELQPTHRAKLTSNSFILDAVTGEVLNRLSNIQTLR